MLASESQMALLRDFVKTVLIQSDPQHRLLAMVPARGKKY